MSKSFESAVFETPAQETKEFEENVERERQIEKISYLISAFREAYYDNGEYEKLISYIRLNPQWHDLIISQFIENEIAEEIPWKELAVTDQEGFDALYEGYMRNLCSFRDMECFFRDHRGCGAINISEESLYKLVLVKEEGEMDEDGYMLYDGNAGYSLIFEYIEQFPYVDHNVLISRLLDIDENTNIYLLEEPKNLNLDTCKKLIELDYGRYVISNIETAVSSENIPAVIDLIIEEGSDVDQLVSVINILSDTQKEILKNELFNNNLYSLTSNLDYFPDIDHSILIKRIIEKNCKWIIDDYFHKFKNLNSDIAKIVIGLGHSRKVINNLDKFSFLDQEVMELLIVSGQSITKILDNLNKFEISDKKKFSHTMIGHGFIDELIQYPDLFVDIEYDLDLINKLFASGQVKFLIEHLEEFKNIDQKEIIQLAIRTNKINFVFEHWDKFNYADHTELAITILKVKNYETFISNYLQGKFENIDLDKIVEAVSEFRPDCVGHFFRVCPECDPVKIVDKLISKHHFYDLCETIHSFDVSMHTDIAIKLIENGGVGELVRYLHRFSLDKKKIGHILLDKGEYEILALYVHNFPTIDALHLANQLIDSNKIYSLINSLQNFKNLDNNIALKILEQGDRAVAMLVTNLGNFSSLEEGIAVKLINLGWSEYILSSLGSFDNFDRSDLLNNLIEKGNEDLIVSHFQEFPGLNKDRVLALKIYNSLSNFESKKEFNSKYHPPLDRVLTRTIEIFGDFANNKLYIMVQNLDNGVIPVEAHELGVKETGATGIAQLENVLKEFSNNVFSKEDFDPKILLDSPIISAIFKKMVNFENSDWGFHNDSAFVEMIRKYLLVQKSDQVEKLAPEYEKSDVIKVDRVDGEEQRNFEYSEHFLQRFQTIRKDLVDAQEFIQQFRPFSKIVEELNVEKRKILDEMEVKLEKIPNEVGKRSLQSRIDQLNTLDLRNLREFQQNFKFLASFTELHPILRKTVFTFAFAKNKTYLDRGMVAIDPDEPTIEDISWMLNFVEQIVNKETFSNYFTDQKAVNEFKKVINVRSFEEELVRVQNQSTKGATSLQFVPTRGILMEFSGHIADACWANKMDSISEKHSNITTVLMVQNPKNKHRRISGACMLIETMSENDEPLLVIRGLNPKENLINTLSVEDFYAKLTNYVRDISEKRGRKPAIVIDDHSGGSATNRVVLHTHLVNISQNMDKVKLKSATDTTFNGYNIVNNTFLIENV